MLSNINDIDLIQLCNKVIVFPQMLDWAVSQSEFIQVFMIS